MEKNKLFVGNLPWSINNESLKELFSQFGEVTEVNIISDRASGRSKGFGFVTFANENDAQKAIEQMNGKEIEDRKIIVSVARPREERTDRGGGGFNRNPHSRPRH